MAKAPAKKMVKKAAPKRKRAHKADGSFQADDPSTPDVNEAFVQEPAPEVHREAQRSVGLRRLGGKLVG
tara:strand:- start:4975 stop:5181 length:207 start_codon:yes stop_codon:yes gene_type:complete